MNSTQGVKQYHPIRVLTGRNLNSKDKVAVQPLQSKGDVHNRQDTQLHFAQHLKRNNNISAPESALKTGDTSEGPRDRNSNSDYLVILDNMDRRIKELMRQAAGLMQVLLSQQGKLKFDEQIQEGLRLMDDKDLEKEYKLLKEKLAALRKYAIIQENQPKKYEPYFTVPNPQVINDKARKLHQEKVLFIKIDPPKSHQRGSSSRKELGTPQKERLEVSKEKSKAVIPENGQLVFTNTDQLNKRAQHYKHKSLKLQSALELLLKDKEATDRINEELTQQLIVLRAETLSLRYQYQKHH